MPHAAPDEQQLEIVTITMEGVHRRRIDGARRTHNPEGTLAVAAKTFWLDPVDGRLTS